MFQLKSVDRIAIVAMIAVAVSIPAAGNAAPLFVTSGPQGVTTYRVDIGPNGERTSTQVLRDATFQSISPGMQAADVFALIGPPYRKARFEATRTTAWDYHYRDSWGYDADFSVIIGDDDRVVSRFAMRNSAG